MSEEVKKISFGFSKLVKPKTSIISNKKNIKSDESVQFIDCVEDKAIKVINEGPKEPDFLVIPLPKQSVTSSKRSELLQKILNNVEESENNDDQPETTTVNNVSNIAENTKIESLDEIAAREIIEDLKNRKDTEDDRQDFTVPLTSEKHIDTKEATLDDYDSIPVDKFGLAMLRGMGWAPGKGIGKTEQVVSTKQPLLRPKGLGLGADKVIKSDDKSILSNEQLKLVKGSFVRIIAGVHKDLFGEVIGFDDETGRLIVKMALGNNILTFNEFMVGVISKDDFHKNSKVINVKKYEEYKLKENSKGVVAKEIESKQVSDDDRKLNQKVKYKNNHRSSSESSIDSLKEKKVKSRETENKLSPSPERNTKEYSSKLKDIVKYSKASPSRSPERYKHSRENTKKYKTNSSSPEQKNSHKYHSRSSYKESSKNKRYRSSSEESSKAPKHISRKETKSKRHSSTSSSGSSSERDSYSKKKELKRKTKKRTSSSDSSSNEDQKKKHFSRSDYKKKCKKNKEKKKSRKRSRSDSGERRRKTKSSKKHKKSKY